ncbi:MAG: RsmB/NOP family class I SAM-dependent RNA methyltransferase [Myxococcales bacterium]|nr:MAG: RsmB/NOP family class I SAM-dependent RNA methyltransferase [Myxococcales bacterium]
MHNDRIFYSACDCITRFNASSFPLKNIAQEIIKSKKLNSKERKLFLDVIFLWSRNRFLAKKFLSKNFNFFSSLSEQEKEKLILTLIVGAQLNWTTKLESSLIEAYNKWLDDLGTERFLIAMGPLLAEEVQKSFSLSWQNIVQSLWEKPKKYIAFDNSVDKEKLVKELKEKDVEVRPWLFFDSALEISGDLKINELSKELREHVWFMDAGSQLIAHLIRPMAHERVLDMCVGEGGKARIISQYPCEYYAVDINDRRLAKAKKILPRTVKFFSEDASKLSLEKNSFDWVLLDAPCSGSGVMRRNPDLVHRFARQELDNYLKLQKKLLNSAVEMLKVNGVVLYVTCSLLARENQQQIDEIMAKTKNLIPVSLNDLIADGEIKVEALDFDKNTLSLLPNIHDCDAFFVAALRKI